MVVIICFTLMVLVATVTEQVWLVCATYLCCIMGILIYQYVKDQLDYRVVWTLTLWFVWLLISMSYIHTQYYHHYTDDTFVIATGTIIEKNIAKYVIKLEDNTQWIYYSDRLYQLGDQLHIFARYKQWYASDRRNRSRNSLSLTRPSVITTWREYQFDYLRYQLMKWLQGTLYETQAVLIASDQWGLILQIKKTLQNHIINTYGVSRTSALMLGILVWDKSLLSQSEYQQFIDTGLVHMIAVSGWNIAILSGFLMIILFFLPYYVRMLVIACVVVVYCLICGMDSSVFRAMIMGLLSIWALMMGRMTSIRTIMAVTWVAMLVYNPYFLVYDLWFTFSFAALSGIIMLSSLTSKINTRRSMVVQMCVVPSLGATIGVLPVMMFAIGKINLTGIVGNMLVSPILWLVMIYSIVSTYLYQRLSRSRITDIQQRAVRYIYWMSDMIDTYSVIFWMQGWWMRGWFLLLMLGILVWYLWRSSSHTSSSSTSGQ